MISPSSTAVDIEKFERNSLNNLLLKSKGAPYEEALRRIINQKLYITDLTENKTGLEQRNTEETNITTKFGDRKDVASKINYYTSNPREGHEKKQDNFNRKTTHSSSSSPQNQRLTESFESKSVGDLDQHSYSQNELDKQSESAFRAGVSSSMQEFQYWLHNNRTGGDAQNEFQVFYEPSNEAHMCYLYQF
jgi:hypothetical protein